MGRNSLWLRLYFQSWVLSSYHSITNNKCLFHITAYTPSATPMYYLTVLWVRSPSGSISFSAQSLIRTKSSVYIWWLRGDATSSPLVQMTRFGALNSSFLTGCGPETVFRSLKSFWLRSLSHLHLKASHGCPLSNLSMSLSVTSRKKLVMCKTNGKG
jgi:hypothetical protein